MNCPNCNAIIANEDINIQKDIAKCQNCNHVFSISSNISTQRKFDANLPPKGAWYSNDFETTIVGAATRSAAAFFLVPFMIVWSGGSLGGIYGSQILSGNFNPFISLFGIPFLIGSVIFWSVTAMAIAGKVEIVFNNEGGKIFTGVGKIGFTKSFIWNDIDAVEESASNIRYPNSSSYKISLVGQKRISFGTGLNDERRYYVMSVLRNYLNSKTRR